MRVRALLVAGIVVVLGIAAAGAFAVGKGTGEQGSEHTVSVDANSLRDGRPVAVSVTLPGPEAQQARVLFVRDDRRYHAFLGVSTHLGCRLLIPGNRRYGDGFETSSGLVTLQDPCGGSLYALSGTCIGGPCPRGLDYYDVKVEGSSVEIDLTKLIRGAPRYAS